MGSPPLICGRPANGLSSWKYHVVVLQVSLVAAARHLLTTNHSLDLSGHDESWGWVTEDLPEDSLVLQSQCAQSSLRCHAQRVLENGSFRWGEEAEDVVSMCLLYFGDCSDI